MGGQLDAVGRFMAEGSSGAAGFSPAFRRSAWPMRHQERQVSMSIEAKRAAQQRWLTLSKFIVESLERFVKSPCGPKPLWHHLANSLNAIREAADHLEILGLEPCAKLLSEAYKNLSGECYAWLVHECLWDLPPDQRAGMLQHYINVYAKSRNLSPEERLSLMADVRLPSCDEEHEAQQKARYLLMLRWAQETLDFVRSLIRDLSKAGTPSIVGTAEGQKGRPNMSKEALALALLVEHPEWSNTRIAKEIGVNRRSLYRWPRFRAARDTLKQGKGDLPRGRKDGETGTVEAWTSEAGEDADFPL